MVVRLGDVLYWAASVIAGLLALIAVYAIVFGTGEDRVFLSGREPSHHSNAGPEQQADGDPRARPK